MNLRKSFLSVMAAAVVALVALAPQSAQAAGTSANVSWNAPTQYLDNSALPATDIASYTITWSPAAGQSGPSGSQTVTALAGSTAVPTSAVVPVACGSVSFVVTVTTTATAKYPNMTSSPSSPLVPYATGVQCGPKAVTGVAAQ